MYNFCFNDCIPKDVGKKEVAKALSDTLKEYDKIKSGFTTEVEGIYTSQQPSKIMLGSSALIDCITQLEHDQQTIAFDAFTKHPIDKFLESDDDDLLKNEYVIQVGGISYDAMSAKVAADNEGILFSLGLHNDLKKDFIDIISNSNETIRINNLFGETKNTNYIINLIKQAILAKLGNFEKLLELLGNNVYSDRFERSFKKASKPIQDSVIEHFQRAIDRKGTSRFYPDGNLIKDVTPSKSKHSVCELRIFSPIAYRVYFHEGTDKIYLALMEKKPPTNTQNAHIKRAAEIIRELIVADN